MPLSRSEYDPGQALRVYSCDVQAPVSPGVVSRRTGRRVPVVGSVSCLWHDPLTPDRERKRMVRLLSEDVTLIKTTEGLTAHLRFRRGATTILTLTRALNAWQLRETSTEIVALIDQLLDRHTDEETAMILNERRYLSGYQAAVPPRHRATYPKQPPPALPKKRIAPRLGLDPKTACESSSVAGRP